MLTTLKKSTKAVILGSALLLSAGLAQANDAQQKNNLMFLVHSDNATVKTLDAAKNLYQIQLQPPKGEIYYFSSRPSRSVGHMSAEKFIALWNTNAADSFKANNPNAAVAAYTTSKVSADQLNSIVVLKKPSYDANSNTLTFDVLKKQGNLGNGQALADLELFIDSTLFPLSQG